MLLRFNKRRLYDFNCKESDAAIHVIWIVAFSFLKRFEFINQYILELYRKHYFYALVMEQVRFFGYFLQNGILKIYIIAAPTL